MYATGMFDPSRELSPEERKTHESICDAFQDLFDVVGVELKDGPAKDEFVKRLAEAKFWANHSLTHDGLADEDVIIDEDDDDDPDAGTLTRD